ncbi:amino acid ABC transporter ATP-binding protein [Tatumella citrea]|uniref:ABC transporter n=1 Tax=Tatumella citrea TaxID=53336 RepID=A0A1Y0L6B8_TATCI|nr:amino acid ABC transporter ATP-binding protein [Tatumella citrea]ARU93219.1 ABC transporter [Tatumella citrea]ARU97258.1 ABC transporter [Tatumella citrea]
MSAHSSLSAATADSSSQQAQILFRQVSKSYASHQVLNSIDLSVNAGEVIAILGPSGSGKSTLIRLVNQLESITSGEIYIDQQPVSTLKGRALQDLRQQIGFVFQQFNLYPHLTALQNITLALEKIHRQTPEQARQRAVSLLKQVGLEDKADHFPAQLSGGQQQRVAIARALSSEPKILLFDEPTSALDPEMIGEVLLVMKQLAHSGITLLVVTHEMQFAREIADRIVFIDQGQILENSHPGDFFRAPEHPRAQRFLQKVLNPLHQESEPL